jgi:uncharacterized protein
VHGNMCNLAAQTRNPSKLLFTLGRHTIGLAHGAGLGPDIETTLWNLFPEADCLIYGHTHQPVCRRYGSVLMLNPGSFQSTGRYGAPGSYAILEAGDELRGQLFSLPPLP